MELTLEHHKIIYSSSEALSPKTKLKHLCTCSCNISFIALAFERQQLGKLLSISISSYIQFGGKSLKSIKTTHCFYGNATNMHTTDSH